MDVTQSEILGRVRLPDAGPDAELVLRRVSCLPEYRLCEDLQSRVWGPDDLVHVPALVLITAQENGGLVIGAFAGDQLVGFVCGFPGIHRDGRFKHASQLMAIDPEFQGSGIGYHLKLAQRRVVLNQGLELITWTFDPLAGINANLNIKKLGCICVQYLVNFYGTTESGLNAGMPTDRLLAEWWVRRPEVARRLEGAEHTLPAGVPVANQVAAHNGHGLPYNRRYALDLAAPALLVDLPANIYEIKRRDMDLARAWRQEMREILAGYFQRGYGLTGFGHRPQDGERRSCYLLQHHTAAPELTGPPTDPDRRRNP